MPGQAPPLDDERDLLLADIIRESIDGATMCPLMAAAEGWPATEWLQPWEPAS